MDQVIPAHCRATKKDGTPCLAQPDASGFCIGHRPGVIEAARKGGYQRSNAARAMRMLPERLRPVADMLAAAMTEVRDGSLDPRQATAMAALASALVRVVSSGELEERVRAIEAQAAERERVA